MGPSQNIGDSIPLNTSHAVSVTLPTWEATVGYEEGEDWVVSRMSSGYPRFFIHGIIQKLISELEDKYGREGERAMVFPSRKVAKRCREFIKNNAKDKSSTMRVLQLSTPAPMDEEQKSTIVESTIGVCFFSASEYPLAKNYWQHSGEGISSRMAEYVLNQLFHKRRSDSIEEARVANSKKNIMLKQELQVKEIQKKSPSISSSMPTSSLSTSEDVENEYQTFVEQKYGRVLDMKFEKEAKIALRRRICGKADKSIKPFEVTNAVRGKSLSPDDVYLYPSGMASIFNAHRALLETFEPKKSVCFGFPYVDTLSILKKFGPGVHFLGLGDDASLDSLESQLESKEIDIMALFCECPSNPLLKTPNLKRIRELADKYEFGVVVDETVGNFLNIHVLPYADMIASSLTKIFSGDSNVLAGSLILNPSSPLYNKLKAFFDNDYEDIFWAGDALQLERNSRDFPNRVAKIDKTALLAVDLLCKHPLISKVYYPSISDTKKYYDAVKTPNGGYGGLISFLFHDPSDAVCFFNAVNLHKGPSLGTNFTLACPYAILAHYQELDEIAQWDVDRNLIRISIGLEDPDELIGVLKKSLDVTASRHK